MEDYRQVPPSVLPYLLLSLPLIMDAIPPPTSEEEVEPQPESMASEGDGLEPLAPADVASLLTCPACGESNPSGAGYCDGCGAVLTDEGTAPAHLSPLPPGTLIGERYDVQQLLREGDGNVYLAFREESAFIIKEAPAHPDGFEREISTLGRIAYPTVTTVVEKIDQADRAYLIGTAPRSIVPLRMVHFPGWREALRAILSLCQTLQKLHDAQILLNDFSNVQWNLAEGRVFIYELAHTIGLPVSLEADDEKPMWADANFAAPEVQCNRLTEIGARSDLYALAGLCYQLLFGHPYTPLPIDQAPSPIVSLPPALHRSLLTCLHADSTQRPESVEAFKGELILALAIRGHQWVAGSDIGVLRRQNQDAYFAQSTTIYLQAEAIPLGLYLVADGMGGGKAGDLASRIAVETCQKSWGELLCAPDFHRKTDSEWLRWVRRILETANRSIIDAAGGDEMGSTATLCLITGGRAYFAHIGDSRAYLIDRERIEQLTEDHSLVARLVRMGELTPEEAVHHPQRHIIYKTLGIEREMEPDCFMRRLSTDQALLLCSDGLHSMVSDDHLFRIANDVNLDASAKVDALINMANASGGLDNVTVVYGGFH